MAAPEPTAGHFCWGCQGNEKFYSTVTFAATKKFEAVVWRYMYGLALSATLNALL
jgi:hypothetical protein